MSSKVERQKRKAQLLGQIQQQRLDLSATRRDWSAAVLWRFAPSVIRTYWYAGPNVALAPGASGVW